MTLARVQILFKNSHTNRSTITSLSSTSASKKKMNMPFCCSWSNYSIKNIQNDYAQCLNSKNCLSVWCEFSLYDLRTLNQQLSKRNGNLKRRPFFGINRHMSCALWTLNCFYQLKTITAGRHGHITQNTYLANSNNWYSHDCLLLLLYVLSLSFPLAFPRRAHWRLRSYWF